MGYIKLHKNEVCKFARYILGQKFFGIRMKGMNIPVFLGIYVLKRNLVLCLFIECIGLKGGIHIILLHGLKYVNSKMKVMNTKV